MAGKVAEIVLNFRPLQNHIFDNSQAAPNRLVIELQPTESVRLYTQVKTPGAGNKVEVTSLGVDLGKAVEGRRAEAYERLLLDVINGKLALFKPPRRTRSRLGICDADFGKLGEQYNASACLRSPFLGS